MLTGCKVRKLLLLLRLLLLLLRMAGLCEEERGWCRDDVELDAAEDIMFLRGGGCRSKDVAKMLFCGLLLPHVPAATTAAAAAAAA